MLGRHGDRLQSSVLQRSRAAYKLAPVCAIDELVAELGGLAELKVPALRMSAKGAGAARTLSSSVPLRISSTSSSAPSAIVCDQSARTE